MACMFRCIASYTLEGGPTGNVVREVNKIAISRNNSSNRMRDDLHACGIAWRTTQREGGSDVCK